MPGRSDSVASSVKKSQQIMLCSCHRPARPRGTLRTVVPKTSKTYNRSRSHTGTRSSYARPEDTQSITIYISSDEGFQTVTLGPLLPTSTLIARKSQRASSGRSGADDDDAALIRPHQQVVAGYKIGCSDFRGVRHAKREDPVMGKSERW
ncbi:hypothetical protein F5141DRAFT_1141968 [Pisolithus sp. B1]|nr:hypothetical protein F5141DRAFT_1141968 [Pisolithus sp. B1]